MNKLKKTAVLLLALSLVIKSPTIAAELHKETPADEYAAILNEKDYVTLDGDDNYSSVRSLEDGGDVLKALTVDRATVERLCTYIDTDDIASRTDSDGDHYIEQVFERETDLTANYYIRIYHVDSELRFVLVDSRDAILSWFMKYDLANFYTENVQFRKYSSTDKDWEYVVNSSILMGTFSEQTNLPFSQVIKGTGSDAISKTANDYTHRAFRLFQTLMQENTGIEWTDLGFDSYTYNAKSSGSANKFGEFTINVSVGEHGSVSPSGNSVSVKSGESQTFTITPDKGYVIGEITLDGVSQTVQNPFTIENVTADHTFAVTFAEDIYNETPVIKVGSGEFVIKYMDTVKFNGKKHFQSGAGSDSAKKSYDVEVQILKDGQPLSTSDFKTSFKKNKAVGTGYFKITVKNKAYKDLKKQIKGNKYFFKIV